MQALLTELEEVIGCPIKTPLPLFRDVVGLAGSLIPDDGSLGRQLKVDSIVTVLERHWKVIQPGHCANEFDLVLYHGGGCPDGLASAWCFWRYNPLLECIGMSYGDRPPNVTGRRVAIVDFSFDRETLEEMNRQASFLYVLDHHRTAEKHLADLPYCEFDMTRSGCEMAWDMLEGSSVERPWFLQAIGDHDVWRGVEESEAVTRAMREAKLHSFLDFDRLYADPNEVEKLRIRGLELLKSDQTKIDEAVKKSSRFRLVGSDLVARIGISPPMLRSEFGHAMAKQGDCDFSVSYQYDLTKGEWWLSFRSVEGKCNVAEMAERYFGSGGHSGASGATLREREKGQTLSQYFTPL